MRKSFKERGEVTKALPLPENGPGNMRSEPRDAWYGWLHGTNRI